MNYDGINCIHDGINECYDMNEYKEKVEGKGDANTALALFKFETHFPDAKIVVIDNDIDKSVSFGRKQGHDIEKIMEIEKERLDGIEGLHIPFDDIDDRLEDIWTYLTDKPFDHERAEMLKDFNIQVKSVEKMDFDAMEHFIEVTDNYFPL